MKLKETEKRLLEAVSKVIEEEGFTKIGINRIAKQSQCDKVLIYRYFGGLDGLLVAWAKQYDIVNCGNDDSNIEITVIAQSFFQFQLQFMTVFFPFYLYFPE